MNRDEERRFFGPRVNERFVEEASERTRVITSLLINKETLLSSIFSRALKQKIFSKMCHAISPSMGPACVHAQNEGAIKSPLNWLCNCRIGRSRGSEAEVRVG